MSLATLKEVLEIAERTNTAIPGFNIDNIEIPEAIMEAAEVENCPVILTIGQGAINAGGLRHLPDVVRRIAESSSRPSTFRNSIIPFSRLSQEVFSAAPAPCPSAGAPPPG